MKTSSLINKRRNELEVWLKERRYSDKLVRGQILKARKLSRSEVLNKWKRVGNNSRFVFNITYHPVLSKLKTVLSEIHLLLAPDREHGHGFEKIAIVGFRRAQSLKDILVRMKVAPIEKALADHVELLGAKYVNMLWLQKHLDLSVPKKNIALSPITWTAVVTMLCIFFHAKHMFQTIQK